MPHEPQRYRVTVIMEPLVSGDTTVIQFHCAGNVDMQLAQWMGVTDVVLKLRARDKGIAGTHRVITGPDTAPDIRAWLAVLAAAFGQRTLPSAPGTVIRGTVKGEQMTLMLADTLAWYSHHLQGTAGRPVPEEDITDWTVVYDPTEAKK